MILCCLNFFFSLLFVCLGAKKLDPIPSFSAMVVFQQELDVNKCSVNIITSLHVSTCNAYSNTPHSLFPLFLKWKNRRKNNQTQAYSVVFNNLLWVYPSMVQLATVSLSAWANTDFVPVPPYCLFGNLPVSSSLKWCGSHFICFCHL